MRLVDIVNPFSWNKKRDFSLENPKYGLSDPRVVNLLQSGQPASSGVHVNEEISMSMSTVFACVKVISESVAELDFHIRKREGPTRVVDESHPLYWMLFREPSPLYNSFDFFQTLLTHVLLWGNAYAQIIRNKFAQPIELVIIEPWNVDAKRLDDGAIFYEVREKGVIKDNVLSSNMIHVKNLGTNGLVGRSPIGIQRESLGNAIAMDRYEGDFYKNGSKHSGVIMTPGHFSEEATKNIEQSFEEKFKGLGKQFKTIFLEDGVKYQQLTIPQQDAQFLENRKFHRSEIAGWFRVPLHLIQDLERATFSNIADQDRAFAKYTISPWCSRIQQEIDRKVFFKEEKRTWFTEFDMDQITRGDAKTRAEISEIEIRSGVSTVNEERRKRSKQDVEGGNEPLVNQALIPLSLLGKELSQNLN